ncbi:site-specific integrase [Lysinibacillus sp. KU-BSD001]|uniref:site-specific integrase n=1 Tax=Lysinibacillus sp. KU-BSD001 TaxID=3141328 RepID=UPI0036EB1282
MKLYKSKKEPEVYYYFTAKDEQLWMFRHKYYDGLTGKRKEKKKSGFQTEKAAIKALLEVKAQTLRGETKQLDNDNLTVSQWLDMWYEMNEKKWKPGTKSQRKNIIDKRIKPRIGNFKLQKLERATYQREFINDLESTGYSVGTIKLSHNIFMIAINAAVEEEVLIRNKLRKAILPELEQEDSAKFLTEAELRLLLNDVQNNENITSSTLFHVLAFTGARKGEMLGLQWQDINFANNTITIQRTRHEKQVNTPKTKNSYRTILVDTHIIERLETYKNWCKKILFKLGERLKDDSFVFIHSNGEIISSLYSNDVLKRIIERTGIPKIVTHSIRHTHATILLNRGLEVKLIAERLGNTPDMIYKVYGHVLKDLEQQAVQIFSASLGNVKHQ